MNLVIAMFYALTVLFNGPGPCAHALAGGETAQSSMHEIVAGHDHSSMHGNMHDRMQHETSQSHQSDHHTGCGEACEGGAGCDGCISAASAIIADKRAFENAPPDSSYVDVSYGFSKTQPALEPPPPRRV